MSTLFAESMFLKLRFQHSGGSNKTNKSNFTVFTVCVFAGGIIQNVGNALYGNKDSEGKSINWDKNINSFVWTAFF